MKNLNKLLVFACCVMVTVGAKAYDCTAQSLADKNCNAGATDSDLGKAKKEALKACNAMGPPLCSEGNECTLVPNQVNCPGTVSLPSK